MKVQMKLDEVGAGSVTVDGHDISNIIRSDTKLTTGGGPAVLTVHLIRSAFEFDGDAAVEVTDETAELLRSIGWVQA